MGRAAADLGEGQGGGGSRRMVGGREGASPTAGRERWIWRELRKDLAREVRAGAGAREEGAPPPSARDPP